MGCWTSFPALIGKAFDRLRPGGWMECQEADGDVFCDDPLPEGWSVKRWWDDLGSTSSAAHRSLRGSHELKGWFQAAGFVDVEEKIYKIPMNGWPLVPELKKLGELWHRNIGDGMAAFSYVLLNRIKGMTKEQIEVSSRACLDVLAKQITDDGQLSLVDVRRDLADQRVHGYQKLHIVWGRKPETVNDSSTSASLHTITPADTAMGSS